MDGGPSRPHSVPMSSAGKDRPGSRALYSTIFEHETRPGFIFDVVLLAAILASIALVMVESVPRFADSHGALLRTLEWSLTVAFTAEYGLRLYCHPRPMVYARSFFGVVDLLAILPTYIAAFVPGTQALVVVRTLRLLRIFRVLKLAQFVHQAEDLRTALRASLPKITVFVIAVLSMTTISGSLLYLIEGPENGFANIPESVYWAIVTLTTVGYGDISPVTPLGKFFASIIMVMGYGVIAVPTGIVSAEIARAPRRAPVGGQACAECGSENHTLGAKFCCECGAGLED